MNTYSYGLVNLPINIRTERKQSGESGKGSLLFSTMTELLVFSMAFLRIFVQFLEWGLSGICVIQNILNSTYSVVGD